MPKVAVALGGLMTAATTAVTAVTAVIAALGMLMTATPVALAQEADIPVEGWEEEINIFDTLFGERVVPKDLNLCEEVHIVNPGFGFGKQDFNTDCPNQIILRNKGISSDSYEVTEVRTDPPIAHNRAALKALDKLTGRLTDIEIALGEIAVLKLWLLRSAPVTKTQKQKRQKMPPFYRLLKPFQARIRWRFRGGCMPPAPV